MKHMNIDPNALLKIPGDVWVFWKNLEGKYLGCNQKMAQALNTHLPEDLIGKSDYDYFEKSEADFYRRCDEEITSNLITRQFYDTATLEHEKRLCLVLKSPLISNDKLIGIIGISYNLNKLSYTFAEYIGQLHTQSMFGINLTKREADCIKYLLRGKTAKEIAKILSLSSRTVEVFIAKIKIKFNVTSKSQLIDKILDQIK